MSEALFNNVRHIVLHYFPHSINASKIAELVKSAFENMTYVSFIVPVSTYDLYILKKPFILTTLL